MPLCPACQQPASKRNGLDRAGRQKYACRPCRRSFTENTISAFSGYRWPRDVIVMTVRWYLAYPLSSRQVLELLAAEVRRRRRVGKRWFVDEVFLFRKRRSGTCIGRLTRTARSWTCCYATIATRRVPRRSFARWRDDQSYRTQPRAHARPTAQQPWTEADRDGAALSGRLRSGAPPAARWPSAPRAFERSWRDP